VVGRSRLAVAPLDQRHVAEAASLAANHVERFRRVLPLLPERWTRTELLAERLADLAARGPAAVALVDGRVVGVLAAVPWERAGLRCVHSPEWANVCIGEQARLAREELYSALAVEWMADGRTGHFIGLLPSDAEAIATLGWLGFGHSNVDGLRELEPCDGGALLEVRVATPVDAEDVLQLELGLRDHLASTPLFFAHDPPPTLAEVAGALATDSRATLIAHDEQGPLAYLRIGPASDDASTIIRDEATASITRAYTRADRRGDGVATALLNAGLAWARERDYVRCAVDYESANLLASRFWRRHFTNVGVTVRRRI
jgi:GNAT superfamily N-acetyltransferase